MVSMLDEIYSNYLENGGGACEGRSDALQKVLDYCDKNNYNTLELESLVTHYESVAEEKVFKDSFKIAFNLFTELLNQD